MWRSSCSYRTQMAWDYCAPGSARPSLSSWRSTYRTMGLLACYLDAGTRSGSHIAGSSSSSLWLFGKRLPVTVWDRRKICGYWQAPSKPSPMLGIVFYWKAFVALKIFHQVAGTRKTIWLCAACQLTAKRWALPCCRLVGQTVNPTTKMVLLLCTVWLSLLSPYHQSGYRPWPILTLFKRSIFQRKKSASPSLKQQTAALKVKAFYVLRKLGS